MDDFQVSPTLYRGADLGCRCPSALLSGKHCHAQECRRQELRLSHTKSPTLSLDAVSKLDQALLLTSHHPERPSM